MYTVRHINVPAPGKATQLAAALEAHSKALNDAGSSAGVTRQEYAPHPVIVNTIRYKTLMDRDAYVEAVDDAVRARRAKSAEARVGGPILELREILKASNPSGDFKFALRISRHPAAGKAGELRKLLEERVGTPPSGSVGANLSSSVVTDSPDLTITVLLPTLGSLEEFRSATRADSKLQASLAKEAGLATGPATTELFRVLLRAPALSR